MFFRPHITKFLPNKAYHFISSGQQKCAFLMILGKIR